MFYVFTRVLYFPYVVVTGVLPESLSVAQERPEIATPVYTIMVMSLLFTVLQLYWGSLVIKQIVKALSGGGDDKKKK